MKTLLRLKRRVKFNGFYANALVRLAGLSLFLLGCSSPDLHRHSESEISPAVKCGTKGRIYDCAANSLYALCRKSGIKLSYEYCLELLPIKREGTSMLELKGALHSVGFQVEAQRVGVDELDNIRVPFILLALPVETPEETGSQVLQSHYFVVWPLDAESVEILDYPREPTVAFTDLWIDHLHSIGVKSIPILLCGKEGQRLDEMLLPEKPGASPTSQWRPSKRKPAVPDRERNVQKLPFSDTPRIPRLRKFAEHREINVRRGIPNEEGWRAWAKLVLRNEC